MAKRLFELIHEGNVDAVREFLETGGAAVVNEPDEDGAPPLIEALGQDDPNLEIITLLLDAGADVNAVHTWRLDRMPHLAEHERTRSDFVASKAIDTNDLQIVQLMAERGADFHYRCASGHNAALDASYGPDDDPRILDFILELGVSPNVPSYRGVFALVAAMTCGHYAKARALITAGADEAPLSSTPLTRAAALGSPEEVAFALKSERDLDARDATGLSALHYAFRRGETDMVQALLKAGASVSPRTDDLESYLVSAVESGNSDLVAVALAQGCEADERHPRGRTALALAAEAGNLAMVKLLLAHGANPKSDDRHRSILRGAESAEVIRELLAAGADPAHLNIRAIRRLLGLGDWVVSEMESVTEKQYQAGPYARFGTENPEDMGDPFRLAMIRSGYSGSAARHVFKDPPTHGCGAFWSPTRVWCFDRMGQTYTALPDGRQIVIGGEHEDFYDADFYIYNDVAVFHPDGSIQLFGYPADVFEPTDFHTATLYGDHIWILGGLGYGSQSQGPMPVYCLDFHTLEMEKVIPNGSPPPRLYKHRSDLHDHQIRVSGGKLTTKGRGSQNEGVYRLDMISLTWIVDSR